MARTTETEIVNYMLYKIGEVPIQDLEHPNTPLADDALIKYRDVLKRCLTRGWNFNTLYDYVITPDGSGYLYVPAGTLDADVKGDVNADARTTVLVDTRLFNSKRNTFVFTNTVKADLIIERTIDEAPEWFRQYVKVIAAIEFKVDKKGERSLTSIDKNELASTTRMADTRHTEAQDANFIYDNYHRTVIATGDATAYENPYYYE